MKVTSKEGTADRGSEQRGGASGSGDGARSVARKRVRIDRDTEVEVEVTGEAQNDDGDEAPAASDEEEFQRAVGERARRIPHGPSKEEERLSSAPR